MPVVRVELDHGAVLLVALVVAVDLVVAALEVADAGAVRAGELVQEAAGGHGQGGQVEGLQTRLLLRLLVHPLPAAQGSLVIVTIKVSIKFCGNFTRRRSLLANSSASTFENL